MTHPEHFGKIWVERNPWTGAGEYITPSTVPFDGRKTGKETCIECAGFC